MLRRQLDEEREERVLVQQELERTTQRVAAMLASMEGVEKEFHTRGDSLVQLEASLHNSTHTIFALQVPATAVWLFFLFRFAIRVVSEMSDRCATPPRCQLGNYTLGTRPAFETRPT